MLAAVLCQPGQAQSELSNGQDETPSGGDVELRWRARDKFDRVRFMNDASSHYFYQGAGPSENVPRHSYLFFPPVAPPLDTEIPALAPLDSGPPAPPDLQAFVGEIFYPMLAARLVSDDLPKPMRARIVAYRDKEVAIQNEIRSRVLALKDADQETREGQLAALAALQGPRIGGTEASAEQLREDLRETGMFGRPVETAEQPEAVGRLVGPAKSTPSEPSRLRLEATAIRAAAFYQEGISLEGRQLLLEAAADIDLLADPKAASVKTELGERVISFTPGPSQIVVPSRLDPSLADKVDHYLAAKNRLKSELRDTLHETMNATAGARRAALAKLSEAQEGRIAALDAEAEDIRRALASQPNLKGPPSPPTLPPELTSRIAAYRRHKVELLKTLRSLLVAPSPTASAAPAAAEPSTTQAWFTTVQARPRSGRRT